MKSKLAAMILLLAANHAHAANLVVGGTIVKVGSTNWNEKVFTVTISGGSGTCADKVITFPENYSQSTIAYAQSHGMAISAFLHNKKVNIHNYGNLEYKNADICTGASSIEISN